MFSISLANPFEVLLGVVFVIIAVLVFFGTFGVGVAYVFSNIKERWHEYTSKKKLKVVSNTTIFIVVLAVLIALSATKLR
jgi:hypothetical protein